MALKLLHEYTTTNRVVANIRMLNTRYKTLMSRSTLLKDTMTLLKVWPIAADLQLAVSCGQDMLDTTQGTRSKLLS
jgi:hypothetical protein